MGPEGQGWHNEGDDGHDNVIRLPREWIGPLEDLIPVGSAADRAAESATATLAGGAPPAPAPAVLDADAFWGGGTSVIPETGDPTDGSGVAVGAHVGHPAPRPVLRINSRSRVPRPAKLVAVLAMAVVALVVVLASAPSPRHHPQTGGASGRTLAQRPSDAVGSRPSRRLRPSSGRSDRRGARRRSSPTFDQSWSRAHA